MKDILKKQWFKSIVSLMPFLSLIITCFAVNVYYFDIVSNPAFYEYVSYIVGQSIFSLIPLFYIVYNYNFCFYSKLSIWGLLTFNLINVIDSFCELINYSIEYSLIFQTLSTSLFLICSTYYLIKNGRSA